MDSFPIMANNIHVLLVEHDSEDHDKTMNMLQYFSYEVTPVKLASTALSILSKEKVQFDLLMTNMSSPDTFGCQLLRVAIKMDMLVILMSNDDDALTTMRALEQGVFLCIKKPVTMQILGDIWQTVLREKLHRLKENEPCKIIKYNSQAKEFGEEDVAVEGNENYNNYAEEKHKSKEKVNSGNSGDDNIVFKRKVWTEWTVELHGKFMDAAKQLGQGRCYPKDILDLMNVPGLTRMQVASHLQKCRNSKWLPPNERKSKQDDAETTPPENKPPRSKTVLFGSMPFVENNSRIHRRIQKNREIINHQEFTIDAPTKTSMLRHNRFESSNNGYHPQRLFHHGVYPFAQDNGTFNVGQHGQTFGMDEAFVYGGQSVTPITNISSNHITENAFALPMMDSLTVQNFSNFQQEFGMDYNGGWQSLALLDQEDQNQIPTATCATNQWIQEGLKPVDNAEIEGQIREEY